MAQKKTTAMGESYKDALERKKKDSFRKQVLKSARGTKREHHKITPKQDSLAERQRKVIALTKEITRCEAKLKNAKVTAENDIYGFFGIFSLVIFAVLMIAGLVLFVRSPDKTCILLMISAVLVLVVSIFNQNASMNAEKEVRRYTDRLRMLKRELDVLTKTPPLN